LRYCREYGFPIIALVTPGEEVTGACSRSAQSSSAPGEIGINSDTLTLAC
jgi:hypothetical protein